MATRPGVYWRVGGYDERLRVAYNDVDYCLRLHQAGYQVVYEPDAALFHAEGSTRGLVEDPDGPRPCSTSAGVHARPATPTTTPI